MITTDIYRTSRLRKPLGLAAIEKYSDASRRAFEIAAEQQNILPVVIRVRDEENDLPGTLRALSRSERPVVPVVVSNGSVDRTVYVAGQMGVQHIIEIDTPGLMKATQVGASYVQQNLGAQVILFTDGDTLMQRKWAGEMERSLLTNDDGDGALQYGKLIWAHGVSKIVDLASTLVFLYRQNNAVRKGNVPLPTGGNFGISFDREGKMTFGLQSLDPDIFFLEDIAIRNAMITAGARILSSNKLSTAGITRGDRNTSLRGLFLPLQQRRKRRLDSYREQYGEIGVYEPK